MSGKKKILTVLFSVVVIAVVLSVGYVLYFTAPKDAVTMEEMFATSDQKLNDFMVTKWHRSYLTVEFNGQEVHLVDQSYKSPIDKKYGITSQITEINFPMERYDWEYATPYYQTNLMDSEFWIKNEFHIGLDKEYVVINDQSGFSQRMVMIEKEEMPNLVDPMTWNNSSATVLALHYPETIFYLVRNVSTNEYALLAWVDALDKNGNEFVILPGGFGPIWGDINVSPIRKSIELWGPFLMITEK